MYLFLVYHICMFEMFFVIVSLEIVYADTTDCFQ